MKNKLNSNYLEDGNSEIRRIVDTELGETVVFFWVNSDHLTLFRKL